MRVLVILLISSLGLISTLQAEDIHCKISPNPASSAVAVNVNELKAGEYKIEIFNVIGSLIAEYRFQAFEGNNTANLNISKYQEGVYLIRVSQSENTIVKRLKIQHTD